MFRHFFAIVPFLFMLALTSACTKEVSFAQDVKPILETYCQECHMRGEEGFEKSGLSMETYADLMKGTKLGPVIEPGSSVSSTLMRLVDHKADESINMPHDRTKLAAAKIKLIKDWIDAGAKNN